MSLLKALLSPLEKRKADKKNKTPETTKTSTLPLPEKKKKRKHLLKKEKEVLGHQQIAELESWGIQNIEREAHNWFGSILMIHSNGQNSDYNVEQLNKIGKLLIVELQKTLKNGNCIGPVLQFDIVYPIYDEKYGEIVKSFVEKTLNELKFPEIKDLEWEWHYSNNDLTIAMDLSSLYKTVKQFSDLSARTHPSERKFVIHNSAHEWFRKCIPPRLEIAEDSIMTMIVKAVEIDNLQQLDSYVSHSSSAVDVSSVIAQLSNLWTVLPLPGSEESSFIAAKIFTILMRCMDFYTQHLGLKLEEQETKDQIFSDMVCVAVNNLEKVVEEIKCLCGQMNFSDSEAVEYKNRLKVSELSKKSIENMKLNITKVLQIETTENSDHRYSVVTTAYFEQTISNLSKRLSARVSKVVLELILESALGVTNTLLVTGLNRFKPPEYFQKIYRTLENLINIFHPGRTLDSICDTKAEINELRNKAELHGSSTLQLITMFYQKQYNEYDNTHSNDLGYVTVKVELQSLEDSLSIKLYILNGRGLKRPKGKSCYPFVKVQLVPQWHFCKPQCEGKTKTHSSDTTFPLFDETIHLSLQRNQVKSGFIKFTLKNKKYIGKSDFLGEALLPFNNESIMPKTGTAMNSQIILPLSLTSTTNFEIVKVLELRKSDKVAREFIYREGSRNSWIDTSNRSVSV